MRIDVNALWPLAVLWIIPLLPLFAAWRGWRRRDPRSLSSARQIGCTIGLGLLSIGMLGYMVFDVQTASMHEGWFDHLGAYYAWVRSGFWTSLAGLFLALFGEGRSRTWAVVSGVALAGLWFVFAATQP